MYLKLDFGTLEYDLKLATGLAESKVEAEIKMTEEKIKIDRKSFQDFHRKSDIINKDNAHSLKESSEAIQEQIHVCKNELNRKIVDEARIINDKVTADIAILDTRFEVLINGDFANSIRKIDILMQSLNHIFIFFTFLILKQSNA